MSDKTYLDYYWAELRNSVQGEIIGEGVGLFVVTIDAALDLSATISPFPFNLFMRTAKLAAVSGYNAYRMWSNDMAGAEIAYRPYYRRFGRVELRAEGTKGLTGMPVGLPYKHSLRRLKPLSPPLFSVVYPELVICENCGNLRHRGDITCVFCSTSASLPGNKQFDKRQGKNYLVSESSLGFYFDEWPVFTTGSSGNASPARRVKTVCSKCSNTCAWPEYSEKPKTVYCWACNNVLGKQKRRKKLDRSAHVVPCYFGYEHGYTRRFCPECGAGFIWNISTDDFGGYFVSWAQRETFYCWNCHKVIDKRYLTP